MMKEEIVPSAETLSAQLDEWAATVLGKDFHFRQYQKELAVNILQSMFSGVKYYIAQCPTGFGKSFLAFAVAGVLSTVYGKRGYILCSDLSLTKQYSDDLDRYLPEWGNLMGQNNYMCNVNGLPFKSGVCRLSGCKSYYEIQKNYPECASVCEYLIRRAKAISSPVTVCTYQQWLVQQNIVRRKLGDSAPFGPRDFVICDEAHNVMDIVQSQFSPKFDKFDMRKIDDVIDSAVLIGCGKDEIREKIRSARDRVTVADCNDTVFAALNDYVSAVGELLPDAEAVKSSLGRKSVDHRLERSERRLMSAADFVIDHADSFTEYIRIIKNAGVDSMIKNDSAGGGSVTFNCINESYLMAKAFHANVGAGLFMSATIGDPAAFARELDIRPDQYRYAIVPSTFDFMRSPINYVSTYKMNYAGKDAAFPRILSMVERIVAAHPDEQGIIQTGNYSVASKIMESASPAMRRRLLSYVDSTTKQDALEIFKRGGGNMVLVGPTLLEGIDLRDDFCRFQIIFKIPYPSLADKYTKAKMEHDRSWYSNKTALSILQGVGRSIRSKDDWAVTYVLDGCFDGLLRQAGGMFGNDFMSRIRRIDESAI